MGTFKKSKLAQYFSETASKSSPLLTTAKVKPTIAIVDPEPASRIGLSYYLEKIGRWNVVWASATAEEAMEKLSKNTPDLLITEIKLPGKDGLEFIKFLLPLYRSLSILVHSSYPDEFYAERSVRAGAMGYLNKFVPMGQIEAIIEQILQGHIYIDSQISLQSFHSSKHKNSHRLHQLSDRELEILILMAQGYSVQDSAQKLAISPRTVQVHRNNIRLKIGLESAIQLHAYAIHFMEKILNTSDGSAPAE